MDDHSVATTPIKVEISESEVTLYKQGRMNFEGNAMVIPYTQRFRSRSLEDALLQVSAIILGEENSYKERLIQRLEKEKLPEDTLDGDGEVEHFIRLRVTAFNDGISRVIQIIKEE